MMPRPGARDKPLALAGTGPSILHPGAHLAYGALHCLCCLNHHHVLPSYFQPLFFNVPERKCKYKGTWIFSLLDQLSITVLIKDMVYSLETKHHRQSDHG